MVVLVQKWKASTAATGGWPGDVSALMIAAGRIFDENDGTFNRYGFISYSGKSASVIAEKRDSCISLW